jgi:hypothetical protein
MKKFVFETMGLVGVMIEYPMWRVLHGAERAQAMRTAAIDQVLGV